MKCRARELAEEKEELGVEGHRRSVSVSGTAATGDVARALDENDWKSMCVGRGEFEGEGRAWFISP